jgi:hypothetical protein
MARFQNKSNLRALPCSMFPLHEVIIVWQKLTKLEVKKWSTWLIPVQISASHTVKELSKELELLQ